MLSFIYNILEKAKDSNRKQTSGCRGLGVVGETVSKEPLRQIWGMMEIDHKSWFLDAGRASAVLHHQNHWSELLKLTTFHLGFKHANEHGEMNT